MGNILNKYIDTSVLNQFIHSHSHIYSPDPNQI